MQKRPTNHILEDDILTSLAALTTSVDPGPESSTRMRDKLFKHIHESNSDYLFVHSHQGEWVSLLKGVDIKLLRKDQESRSFLIRMAPGSKLPPHEHALDEESLVLEGEATINGVLCHAGDYHMAPKDKPHGWLTSEHGCLLFVRGAVDSRRHA